MDKEKILRNFEEPEKTIEYLFIEKAKKQKDVLNKDQGYLYAYNGLYKSDAAKGDELETLKAALLKELNYCVKSYKNFHIKSVDFNEYKFGLVDIEKNITVFEQFDSIFFKALKESLGNLIITGKNFDLIGFKTHKVYAEWVQKYQNKI
jgi:hypothetical protein